MINDDISYFVDELGVKFNYRVAGLIQEGDKIFVQKNVDEDLYFPLGGRVKYLEHSDDALIREIKEEIGIEIKHEDLTFLDVIENFFTYKGVKFHELLFVYKINTPKELLKINNMNSLDKEIEFNTWVDIKELPNLNLQPEELKKYYK